MTTYFFPLFRRRGEANAAPIPGEACPRVQEDQTEIPQSVARVRFLLCSHQCCGAGADSRGAEIKLPPGAGITNCGSGSFLFKTNLKFYRKKLWLLKKFLKIVTILILLLSQKG
jgi:hypothetical protein